MPLTEGDKALQLLRELLASYPVDEWLPSLNELSEQWGLHRSAIGRAARQLVADGELVARQGKGYYRPA